MVIITLQHGHSKQLPVGLMVLSDGMVHFLKIEIFFFFTYLPKLSCGFNMLYIASIKCACTYIEQRRESLSKNFAFENLGVSCDCNKV